MNIKEKILTTEKPVYIRFGFGWKGAKWKQTTKENLLSVLERKNYARYDINDVNDGIGISFYSANDMY